MIIEKNVWIIRPMPHGNNRMKQFLDDDFIAIGYPAGVSFKNLSYDDIRGLLEQENWADRIGNVNLFVIKMRVGDFILVPDDNKKDVYIGVIESDYYHDPKVDKPNEGFYPHQRKVKWLFDKNPLLRSDLPEEIRGSLRYPGTIANITKHIKLIEDLLNTGRNNTPKNTMLEKAFKVLEELLEDNNSEIRLKAAEIIVKQNTLNE
jgi:restriction system protein